MRSQRQHPDIQLWKDVQATQRQRAQRESAPRSGPWRTGQMNNAALSGIQIGEKGGHEAPPSTQQMRLKDTVEYWNSWLS